MVSALQHEHRRDDTIISEQPLHYNIPSVSRLAFSDAMQPDHAAYNRVQANSQMQNIGPPTSVMVVLLSFLFLSSILLLALMLFNLCYS